MAAHSRQWAAPRVNFSVSIAAIVVWNIQMEITICLMCTLRLKKMHSWNISDRLESLATSLGRGKQKKPVDRRKGVSNGRS